MASFPLKKIFYASSIQPRI